MELVEVGGRQHVAATERWIAERGQTRRIERFAQVEAKMAERVRRQRRGDDGRRRDLARARQVRIVRMSLRSNLFLFAPFCPPVLEPNLQKREERHSTAEAVKR